MAREEEKVKGLKRQLLQKYTDRALLRRKLSKLHEDNNFNDKPFNLYRLKGLESDIAIISDEIAAMELEIETLE